MRCVAVFLSFISSFVTEELGGVGIFVNTLWKSQLQALNNYVANYSTNIYI